MPNWTFNRLSIIGEPDRVDALLRAVIPADQDAQSMIDSIPGDEMTRLPFTFQGLIPRPQVLEHTASMGCLDLGLAVLSDAEHDWLRIADERDPLRDWLPPDMVKTRGRVLARFELEGLEGEALMAAAIKKMPECIEQGRAAIRAYEETGYLDWHAWSQDHWGTKWDPGKAAYQMTGDHGVTILFDTANSPPVPFFRKLVESFPDLNIHGASVEPGNGIAFIFTGEGGVFSERRGASIEDAYMEVFGEPPEAFGDDEGEMGPGGPR